MHRLFAVAVVGITSLLGSTAVAQNVCRPQPVRQRLIFRLFRRVQPRSVARPVVATPAPAVASNICPAPIEIAPVAPMSSQQIATAPNAPTLAPTETNVKPTENVVPDLTGDASPSPAPPAPKPTKEDLVGSPSDTASNAESVVKTADKKEWRSLFDGKELGEWKTTKFGGEGSVEVKDQQIKLDYGQYMTGVTHSGKGLPKTNYEIELEATREDGSDFFCGLTFPVDDSFASLICGGWGGSVIGVSSIDGMDASENTTTAYKAFKNKQWYKVRVRVTKGRLQAWIDDKLFVDEEVTGDRLSTRIEMDRCQPLGIASFDTQAAVRNIRIREVKEPAKEK